MDGSLHVDIGIGHVVELPDAENERRWQSTTPQVRASPSLAWMWRGKWEKGGGGVRLCCAGSTPYSPFPRFPRSVASLTTTPKCNVDFFLAVADDVAGPSQHHARPVYGPPQGEWPGDLDVGCQIVSACIVRQINRPKSALKPRHILLNPPPQKKNFSTLAYLTGEPRPGCLWRRRGVGAPCAPCQGRHV